MSGVLFVSNGHGEEAVSARIAEDVRGLAPVACDHLALVGSLRNPQEQILGPWPMRDVGPRRGMPSGGLIAMGNLRNIARDLGGGLLGHTLRQLRFLSCVRGHYVVAVAVGDIFALLMAKHARARSTIFVGTAKSVHVAAYGRMEERALRGAASVFVRDAATAQRLQAHGIAAEAANIIVDLYKNVRQERIGTGFETQLALFPGSRAAAYEDGVFLCRIAERLAERRPDLGAVLSIAPNLDPQRFAGDLARDGWRLTLREDGRQPFSLFAGEREIVRAWRGSIGAALANAALVLGQAGTANEAAAAGGVPVIAFERTKERGSTWYRRRQSGLLGEALLIVPRELGRGVAAAEDLLNDPARLARMSAIGRERMGTPGGARLIAERIVAQV